MKRRRPGSVTTFAILNFVFAGLLLICGVNSMAGNKGDATITVNGVRRTIDLNDHLRDEVPGYGAYPVITLIVSLLLAAGFIVSGVGLLQVQNWGRILAVVSAGATIGHQVLDGIYELGFVLPAIKSFMGGVPLFGGLAAGAVTAIVVVRALILFAYAIVLLVSMLQGSMARVFAGDYRGEPDRDEDYPRSRRDDYDDDFDDRPRRRSRRDDDDPPRRRRRPDEDDDY
jgi:hypothetical protein